MLAVGGPEDFEGAFETATTERAEALITLGGTLVVVHRPRIIALAAQHRLPAMYHEREAVVAGGLMGYGVNLPDLFRRAATYVDRILKGARPADLPVEQSMRFDLAINL